MSSGSSRSSSAFDAALDVATSRVLDRLEGQAAPVVLVDGRSGSGKTTLAARLAARWGRPVHVIALDDVYPGWDGLDGGVEEVRRRILEPRSRGAHASWRRWDWVTGQWAEEHSIPADTPLIVEGSGLLTPTTARLADLTVWLESPDVVRKARALARDGDLYRPHWDRWAAQEEKHVARDGPQALAALTFPVP